MAVEKVNLNAGDNKSDVAYKMALSMWVESKGGYRPKIEDKDAFLDLVQDCARALTPRYAFAHSK